MKTIGHKLSAPKSPSDDERRVAPRQKIFVEAWADPGGTAAPVLCKVLDISQTGAKIAEPSENLPNSFSLRIGSITHVAKVIWRNQRELGVEFKTPTGGMRAGQGMRQRLTR